MSDLDRVPQRVSDGIRLVLTRVGSLALGVAKFAAVIGIATFGTGWWVFDRSHSTWLVVGGLLCVAPCAAALLAWYRVRTTVRATPNLIADVRKFMGESDDAAATLITFDGDQRLMSTSRTFSPLRPRLLEHREQLPALWAGVQALTTLPGLAAIALLGTLAVGALGTVLLIVGLIS